MVIGQGLSKYVPQGIKNLFIRRNGNGKVNSIDDIEPEPTPKIEPVCPETCNFSKRYGLGGNNYVICTNVQIHVALGGLGLHNLGIYENCVSLVNISPEIRNTSPRICTHKDSLGDFPDETAREYVKASLKYPPPKDGPHPFHPPAPKD